MNVTVWYLSTCSTCTRILKELGMNGSNAELIDIKTQQPTKSQLTAMKNAVGSYKALINGRSQKFRTIEKKANDLDEEEVFELLSQHYSFLKRPVIRVDGDYFVGNSHQVVEEIKSRLDHG